MQLTVDLRDHSLNRLPKSYIDSSIKGVLIKKEQIDAQISKLAVKINKDIPDAHCLVIMSGAMIFASDMIRKLKNCTYDSMQVKSYLGKQSSRLPKILKDPKVPLKGKDVLILEDIVDTGHTLKGIIDYCIDRGARSVKIAALLSKPSRREIDVKIDYCGFIIDDLFVIGYGLDYDEKYRNIPFIAVL